MPRTRTEIPPEVANRVRRYKKAAALLRKWMAEEDDYDERVGTVLEQELKDSAMRCGEPDEAGA